MLNFDPETKRFITDFIQDYIDTEFKKLNSDFKHKDTLLLSRKEAANLLKMKENTLATWATKGIGPAPTKIGNSVRYRWTVLEQYIIDNTMPR